MIIATKPPCHDFSERVICLLRHDQCDFSVIHHKQTVTSAQSALQRCDNPQNGGKALFLRVKQYSEQTKRYAYRYIICVMSSTRRLKAGKLKKILRARSVSFAPLADLTEKTGLVKGALPPFGEKSFPDWLPFDLYVDKSIQTNTQIGFNAGSLTTSVIMTVSDYLRISQPKMIIDISE